MLRHKTSIFFLSLVFGAAICFSPAAHAAGGSRNFALELQYGTLYTNFLPLNHIGETIYGSTVFTTPLTGRIVWSILPSINIGVSCSTATWLSNKTFLIGGIYASPKLTFTTVRPFIDLTPLMIGTGEPSGITKGFFVEVGPGMRSVDEQYTFNGTPYSFSSSGLSMDISLGYRAINKAPLSFVASLDISVPIASDGKKSDTGISLNGAVNIGINCGFCLSF